MHWRSDNAACPSGAANDHLLGGTCWFTTIFFLTTSLGLASIAFVRVLLISARAADLCLVPNADADHLLGEAASVLIMMVLVVAIVSTGQDISS